MKFTSTLMLAVILCSALVCANAQEPELSVQEPEAFYYDIELRMDQGVGPVGLQVWDKEKLYMYYLDETNSYIQNADGSVTYQFERFRFRKSMPSGEYIVRAYGGGQACEQTFVFVNESDRRNMLNRLNEAGNDTIGDCILESALILEVDVSYYERLSADWKRCVEDEIMKLDVSINDDESNLNEKITLYQTQLQRVSTIAAICSEQDSARRLEMIEKSDIGLRLDGYYAELSKNSKQDNVMEYLSKVAFSSEDGIDPERLSKEFDGAVLLSVIDAFDWGTIEKALIYYEKTGLITLDRTQFNKLSKAKQIEVYKALKNAGLENFSEIAGSFVQICKSYSNEGTSGSGGSGTTSGGSRPVSFAPIQPQQEAAPVTEPEKTEFQDIAVVPWAADSIRRLAEKGVLAGRSVGRFCPNEPVKREEFVKMTALAFGLETELSKAVFEDVAKTDWSYPYIAAAVYYGVITGINEQTFGVGSDITRQDMAVILHRVYQMAGTDGSDTQFSFLDEGEISDYAKTAVHVLAGANLISGRDDGCFDPKTSVTRAEAAKLIDSVVQKVGGSN